MKTEIIESIIKNYILSSFSGVLFLEGDERSGFPDTKRWVSRPKTNNNYLSIKVSEKPYRRILIKRSQPFQYHEIDYIRSLYQNIRNDIKKEDDLNLKLDSLVKKAVSKSIGVSDVSLFLKLLNHLDVLSTQTYEGRNIPIGIIIDQELPGKSTDSIFPLLNDDVGKVLSNGYTSAYLIDKNYNYNGLIELAHRANNPYAPIAYNPIANETKDNVVCVVLNISGDILIFKDGKLKFVRRSGIWHILNLDNLVRRMGLSHGSIWKDELRLKIIETILDCSFAHTGGLIILVRKENEEKIEEKIILPPKYKLQILNGIPKNFSNLHREIRKEIVAIDGATILDYTGKIRYIGTIIKATEYSGGGSREAAAITMASLGLAIKISMDGKVTGFYSKDGKIEELFNLI